MILWINFDLISNSISNCTHPFLRGEEIPREMKGGFYMELEVLNKRKSLKHTVANSQNTVPIIFIMRLWYL